MKQRLPLAPAAVEIAAPTILLQLRDVAANGAPAFDLALIIGTTAPEVIAAIPLKPSARIFMVNPTFFLPDRERLRSVHAEEIERGIVTLRAKLRFLKPVVREFLPAIGHVFPAEDAEPEQLFRSYFRFESGREIFAGWFGQQVFVAALHPVIHFDPSWFGFHAGPDVALLA